MAKKRKKTPSKRRVKTKKTASKKTARKLKPAPEAMPREPRMDVSSKRNFPRVPVRFRVDYFKDPGVFLYDYSCNLGRGGIFIESEQPFSTGTELTLVFTLPELEETIEVVGKVVWVHQKTKGQTFKGVPGMGIQFQNPAGRHKEALDRFFKEIDFDNLSF